MKADLVFKALGDATRLKLIEKLFSKGPKSISQLSDTFAMTRQGITKHLQILSKADVIEIRDEGRSRMCYLNPAILDESQKFLKRFNPQVSEKTTVESKPKKSGGSQSLADFLSGNH